MRKLIEAIGVVLLVCIGVRIGAALLQPVLPLLGGVVAVAIIAWWVFGHQGPGRGYRRRRLWNRQRALTVHGRS